MSISVYSAGSLRKALPAMAAAVGLDLDIVFGPAGLLRRRIEDGERPGLFFSASMAHAEAVAALGDYGPAHPFAENRLCLTGRSEILKGGDVLSILLDPANRLGTSTPGADPGGDYAFSVFDRAEAVRAGSRDLLRAKAMPLVGGDIPDPKKPTGSPVLALFQDDKVDIFLGYRTSALDLLASQPGLDMVELPPELAVRAVYGACVIKDDPVALEALELLRKPEALASLERCGFSRP